MEMKDVGAEDISPDNHPLDKIDLSNLTPEQRRRYRVFARDRDDLGKYSGGGKRVVF